MPFIHLLTDDLIGKIAAGEVVERPASVIKELVENSIDAGAKDIKVSIDDGGRSRMCVTDDGCGMGRDDLKLSILRHATSKIKSEADLFNIRTMGFRGEALPSIAAVSRSTIETKEKDSLSGLKMIVHGGRVVETGDFGCPDGTSVTIEDLFFNTPARKKFLKSDKTEEGHVADVLNRLALAYPERRFRLVVNGRERSSYVSVNDPKARLFEVFGEKLAGLAFPFEEAVDGLRISGFLGVAESVGMVSQGVHVFINKRFVRDRVINHAVVDGYRSLVPHGSSPFAVIMLDVDPSRVDVNVHPAKQEVRFDNSGAIHGFVANAVRKWVQNAKFGVRSSEFEGERSSFMSAGHQSPATSHRLVPTLEALRALKMPEVNVEQAAKEEKGSCLIHETLADHELRFSDLKVIGQLFSSFIVCESRDGEFVAIDQHAVHERIGFEKLKGQLASGAIERQQLLIPEQIELQAKDAAYISENLELLEKLGIEIEPFGGKTFVIKSIPALFAGVNMRKLVVRIAEDLIETGRGSSFEEAREKILKTIACHAQVRANHPLKIEEMESLVCQMDKWPNTTTCPHGRPSYKVIARSEVEKWFGR